MTFWKDSGCLQMAEAQPASETTSLLALPPGRAPSWPLGGSMPSLTGRRLVGEHSLPESYAPVVH
jgi:hypothetical protein